jgi:hypothetical protein
MKKPKPPKILDAMVAVVLAYRPKNETRAEATTDAPPLGEGSWPKFGFSAFGRSLGKYR